MKEENALNWITHILKSIEGKTWINYDFNYKPVKNYKNRLKRETISPL